MSPEVSLVVPVRDEEDSVSLLGMEIATCLDEAGLAWECWWIDDGSSDQTWAHIGALADAHPGHRALALEANYGQSAALAVGFRHARAEVLATLDGDLQNDPADIPVLYRKLRAESHDMVTGWRRTREDGAVRRFSSRVANGVRSWILGDGVRDVGCSVRVFRKVCVEDLPVFRGMHRFLPALARMKGLSVVEHPVNHRPRLHGTTKYGIGNRLWVGITDLLAMRWLQVRGVHPKLRRDGQLPGVEPIPRRGSDCDAR